MIYRFLGIEIMRFTAQVEDIWRSTEGEFVKIGYKINFFWLTARKGHVDMQVTIVSPTVKQALREVDVVAHADMISSGIGAELNERKHAKKAARVNARKGKLTTT